MKAALALFVFLLCAILCSAYKFPGLRKIGGSQDSCPVGETCDESKRPDILIVKMQNLESFKSLCATLYLWQTIYDPKQMPERILSISILAEPLVAIGHNQNPWKETKPLLLKEDGVVLMRRTSGGGAGYGDKDQLMLTFVQSDHDLEPAFNVMKIALAKFGIKAERSGRNDLIVEGKKVSGSTFMTSKTKFLHSASLLVNSSLHLFGKYLTPNRLKLESKGTKSVEGRVSTLTAFNPNITVASASDAVLEAYIDVHKGKSYEIHEVDIDEMMQHADFQRNYAKSTDPAWIYGETREFSHQLTKKFPWALMEVHIESKGKSIISDVIIYSDAMHDELIPILARNLKGVSYSAEGVAAAMAKSKEDFADYPDTFANIDEFGAWLTENL